MKNIPAIDLSGLDSFDISSLMAPGEPTLKENTGQPLEIELSKIVEDPDQPRTEDNPGFSRESLGELAESIKKTGGLKVPISVRSMNDAGLYVINHGARRYRASVVAGMKTIKAFIDDGHSDYDQAIENIQRENFTPMEIALFIDKREKNGDSRTAIAAGLGKSKAFVTQHAALLTLPNEIRAVYDDGVCRDVLALYELNRLYKEAPQNVLDFIANGNDISRGSVEELKSAMKDIESSGKGAGESVASDDKSKNSGVGETTKPSAAPKSKTELLKVMVKHQDRLYMLRLDLRPSALHLGWIEEPESGLVSEAELSDMIMDSII